MMIIRYDDFFLYKNVLKPYNESKKFTCFLIYFVKSTHNFFKRLQRGTNYTDSEFIMFFFIYIIVLRKLLFNAHVEIIV